MVTKFFQKLYWAFQNILKNIMNKEGITIDQSNINKIIKDDLRKSINNLQKLIFLNRKCIKDAKVHLKYFDDDIILDIKKIILTFEFILILLIL